MPKKPRHVLQVREYRAFRNWLEGETPRQASLKAGFKTNNYPKIFERIRPLMEHAMVDRGLDQNAFVTKLIEKLGATRLQVMLGEIIETDDHQTQMRALEQWARILGVEAAKKEERKTEININIEDRRKAQQGVWERLGGID